MRMKKVMAAVALAFGVPAAAQAAISFDPDGAGGLGPITVGAFDWGPTTLLGLESTTAIQNFIAGQGPTTFDALIHSTLIGTLNAASQPNTPAGLGTSFEITMIARFTETVTGVLGNVATFSTVPTAPGFLEFYYDTTVDANQLEGSGFNDGRLILSATGVGLATGNFQADVITAPLPLDGSPNGDQYPGQLTLTGNGSNGNITITGLTADPTFFLAVPSSITLAFANISEGLPFISVDPSDCFTPDASGAAVGGNVASGRRCAGGDHVLGTYAVQPADPAGGIVPNTGNPNGAITTGPDQVFQTDFNSPMNGIPEPGSLALLGSALGIGAWFGTRRRKQA